jgi:5-keto-L-gluconate epimerase
MKEVIKLSVAIASQNALPSAFVVFRGFEESIIKASELGYNGIELALKSVDEIDPKHLNNILETTGMEVSCISTGQVFADTGLMFTDTDPTKRIMLIEIFKGMIDLASDFGHIVNIGRVRGRIENDGYEKSEKRFIDMSRELCAYASPKGVKLVLEPVNRYEINFINNVEEGVELMKKVDMPNMKLMPDVFHMNIEDVSIGKVLEKNIDFIEYIHLADSNRLAPGQGHTDFVDIFNCLKRAGYNGWTSVEILPKPSPVEAAKQAAEFLIPLIKLYNNTVKEINYAKS